MAFWILAKKELRLLLRDPMAAALLLGMPILFILVLGLLLGEGFGQKPDDRLRVSIVDLDEGPCLLKGVDHQDKWSEVVRKDLADTAGIRVELIDDLATAEQLVAEHKRAAVIVFSRGFSASVNRCSFLKDGINPFHRDGVFLDPDHVDATLLKDAKQPGASSLIDQVGQVTLLRVLLPWMIGQAFEKLSQPEFIQLLGDEVNLPVPSSFQGPLMIMSKGTLRDKISLSQMLKIASENNEKTGNEFRGKVGAGVQAALAKQFEKYNLTGKTWASLTRSKSQAGAGAEVTPYVSRDGNGFLNRGAQRYQVLVPSYTVMFAFFLVLNVGWVFVTERRQGTLRRLQAAPITRSEILLGKLVPYFLLSLFQGLFLLAAGRVLFGMRWGPAHWSIVEQLGWVVPVVFSTSLAAMGMAVLVASVSRSEMQVTLYGAVPVLVLSLIGGCILPRELMPEQAQQISLIAPQGWALAAYREFLDVSPGYEPNQAIVLHACGVLCAFGIGFLACRGCC